MPETIMHGVKQHLSARVMECANGGYIVLFDGYGLAARSNWQDAIACIEEIGYDQLNIPRYEPSIPSGIDPSLEVDGPPNRRSRLHSSIMLAAAILSTIIVALSVKIA